MLPTFTCRRHRGVTPLAELLETASALTPSPWPRAVGDAGHHPKRDGLPVDVDLLGTFAGGSAIDPSSAHARCLMSWRLMPAVPEIGLRTVLPRLAIDQVEPGYVGIGQARHQVNPRLLC